MSALSGDARDRLAKLLLELWEEDAGEPVEGLPGVSEAIDAYLDRLLPVVAELADQAAAEELRALGADLSDRQVKAVVEASTHPEGTREFLKRIGRGGAYGVAASLADARAAALTPTAEGDPQ